MRRSRSSASGGSGFTRDRSSRATLSAYRRSLRSRSMARLRAVVISHAPGRSGMPSSGHVSRAARRLSWTTSSAMSKLPMIRTRAPVSLAASSRKMATSAASVAVRVSVRPSSFHSRPYLDGTGRPRLGHLERLVEILDLDDGEAANYFLRLHKRPVGDDWLAVVEPHGGGCLRPLQLLSADDLAGATEVLKPFSGGLHPGIHLLWRHAFEALLIFHGPHEKQDVFHVAPP